MKIMYYLKETFVKDPDLFDTKEKLIQNYCWMNDKKNPKYVENNIAEVDIHSDEYILRNIPTEFHAALKHEAYELGHAYNEEHYYLSTLADALEEPIKKYTERLLND